MILIFSTGDSKTQNDTPKCFHIPEIASLLIQFVIRKHKSAAC